MRRALVALLCVSLGAVLSCSDMPTSPLATVTVQGTIVDRDGAPIQYALLIFRVFGDALGRAPVVYAQTDLNGHFEAAMTEGAYDVRIEPRYLSGMATAHITRFEASRSSTRLDYRFTGTMVSGDVTGPGGSLLGGATVRCYDPNGDVEASAAAVDGHYSLIVPTGHYWFTVQSGDYLGGLSQLMFQADISPTDTSMSFSLGGNEVTVTVALHGTTPLAGATVLAQTSTLSIRAANQTDLNGTAKIYLPNGDYQYYVNPPFPYIAGPEYGTLTISTDVAIAVDFPVIEWNATLRRASDNAALANAQVDAHELASTRRAYAVTDPFGKFRMFVRPNTGYALEIYPRGFLSNSYSVPFLSSAADSTFDVVINAP